MRPGLYCQCSSNFSVAMTSSSMGTADAGMKAFSSPLVMQCSVVETPTFRRSPNLMVETEDKWRWVTSAGGHIPPTCDPLFKILGALLAFAMRGICERFQCQLPLGLGEGHAIVLPSLTAPANLFLVYHTTLCFSPFTLVVDCSRARATLDITYANLQHT
ncbi:hypothetical protein FA13DRAFT_399377 [Coprinellus micaceus]|uniref:Uncharacterized protein n=1 Tax=Coprinellus micaceus TaxID=71717 RepID=A0A4Y7TXP5_COPMI|nr:hypothetical protein FA13DRAFT_399377 [Coprinellus micaceus]